MRVRARVRALRAQGTQQLVAFMHGVVSHYIADINWHGLLNVPSGYGFIETLGGPRACVRARGLSPLSSLAQAFWITTARATSARRPTRRPTRGAG